MSQVCVVTCPNCAGKISRQLMDATVICEHCGCEFTPDESMWELPVSDVSVDDISIDAIQDVSDFVESAPWVECDDTSDDIVTYNCSSCGASLIARQSALTTQCPYCGNELLLAGLMSEYVMFDSIIPFTVDERAAQAAVQEFLKHRWYLPSDFKNASQHLQAVYVPYYAMDIRVSGEAVFDCDISPSAHATGISFAQYRDFVAENHTVEYAEAYRKFGNTEQRSLETRDIRCSGEVLVHQIWVDASAKMLDVYMRAIAPFPVDKLVPFSTSYIVGQMAESPDVSYDTCFDDASKRSRWFLEEHLALSLVRNADVFDIMFEKEFEPRFESVSSQLCLLPVWFSYCEYQGEHYLIVVNGATGRCVSELPRSNVKRYLILGIMIAGAFISFIGAAVFFPLLMLFGFGFIPIIVMLCIGALHSYDDAFASQLSNVENTDYTVSPIRVTDKKFQRQK